MLVTQAEITAMETRFTSTLAKSDAMKSIQTYGNLKQTIIDNPDVLTTTVSTTLTEDENGNITKTQVVTLDSTIGDLLEKKDEANLSAIAAMREEIEAMKTVTIATLTRLKVTETTDGITL